MTQKVYVVEGRQFRTQSDYACAKRDKEIIDSLRRETDFTDRKALEELKSQLRKGKYHFQTLLGQDFLEEIEELLKKEDFSRRSAKKKAVNENRAKEKPTALSASDRRENCARRVGGASEERTKSGKALKTSGRAGETARAAAPPAAHDKAMEAIVQRELEKRERRRKLFIAACSVAAVFSLGYVGLYTYYNYRTESDYQMLSQLKERTLQVAVAEASEPSGPLYTLDEEPEQKEVLEEYKNLLIRNKKLIGWVKIDDTNIDYPVMQTDDNEYYLHHNLNQQYDKNGSIFMDKDCDVLKPSTNFIIYGHHTKTGQMFGKLELYQDEEYYKEHPYINFDTIYEKGVYQIMYVFRSRVYKEDEIVFKYYQFIDANGETEFNSNMQEMAALSFYDTGVTAEYGDQLLTLSTCDYQEKDGRFVIVAKKIAKE